VRGGILFDIRDRESDADYCEDEEWSFEAWCGPRAAEEFQVAFAKNSGVWPVNKRAIQRLRTEDPVFVALNNIEAADVANMLRIDYQGVNVSNWYDQWNRAVSK
jgi:hypothetical protein